MAYLSQANLPGKTGSSAISTVSSPRPRRRSASHPCSSTQDGEAGEKSSIERVSRIADRPPDQDTVIPLLAAHQGLDGAQLVAILAKLEAPYDRLQAAGAEGGVPAGDAVETATCDREGQARGE